MKFARTLLLGAALSGAAAFWCDAQEARGQQQQKQQQQIVVPLPGTGYVAFKTKAAMATLAPSDSASSPLADTDIARMLKPQMLVDEGNLIHRVLVDHEGRFVFGYDLSIEPMSATKQFKIFVKPLSAELEKQLRARDAARLTPAEQNQQTQINKTLPREAVAQIIDDGDELSLDLLINQQSGVKIIDLVKVSSLPFRSPDVPFAYPPPRDFTLNNVELAMRDFKLRIGGEEVATKNLARECKGALLWFYVPGRGRFIFSLAPHAGYDFRKVGVIEDNKISFTLDGATYEWISRASVINANDGKWNLWVLYDKDFTPDLYAPEQNAGETKSVEAILRKAVNAKQSALKTKEANTNTRSANPSPNSLTRISVGAADRIENLLPRK